MHGGFDPNDKRWKSGVFRPGRLKLFSAFVVTLILLLLSSKLLYAEDDAFGAFLHWKKLLHLVHLFTLTSMVWLVKVVLRSWKFRGSKFIMDEMPGVIGGDFRGVLVLPNSFTDNCKIKVEIVNVKTAKQSHSERGDRSIKTTRLYSDMKYIPVSSGKVSGRFVEVPVEFKIPFQTRDESEKEKEISMGRDFDVNYKWILIATAEIKGADLDLDFEVPIFRTEQSDVNVKEPVKDIYKLQKELLDSGGPARIRVIEEAGCKYYSVKGSDHFSYVFCGLFGLCLLFVAVFAVEYHFKGFNEVGRGFQFIAAAVLMFVVILGALFVGIIGLIGVIAYLRAFSRKETWVDFGYVCQRGRFFLYSWEKKIELGQIKNVQAVKYSSREYYETYRVFILYKPPLSALFSRNRSLKELEVADSIDSKTEAIWLKDELFETIVNKV